MILVLPAAAYFSYISAIVRRFRGDWGREGLLAFADRGSRIQGRIFFNEGE
jgi:hypothetical protein